MADIVVSVLDVRQDGGDAAFHLSNSYSPPANQTVLLVTYCVQLALTPPPVVPIITGNSVTWVSIFSQLFGHGGTDRARVSVFRMVDSAPATGQTRVQYTTTQLRFATTILGLTQTDIGNLGANAIVQFKSTKIAQNVTTTPSITLDNPAAQSNNSVIGICGYGDTDLAQNPAVVAGPGFNLIQNNPTTETGGQAIEFKQQLQQLVDWQMNLADFDWAPMALEIQNVEAPPDPDAPQVIGRPSFISGNLITP